jgi:hypothetical protein
VANRRPDKGEIVEEGRGSVREECLQYALHAGDRRAFRIWGGMTGRTRPEARWRGLTARQLPDELDVRAARASSVHIDHRGSDDSIHEERVTPAMARCERPSTWALRALC